MATKKDPTCFVIMPISDHDGYDKGHFKRVYEYIIKPACEKAGFKPTRADDENKTNYIVIDIIKKILESDTVICDLSSKNPNVLYELGIRQAFNKKAILIKDIRTSRIFDIQGIRTLEYNESLRIDTVIKDVNDLSLVLKETHESSNDEVNSLIQLLSIQPAKLSESFVLSNESSLILDAIKDIQNRMTSLEYQGQEIISEVEVYEISNIKFVIGWYIMFEGKEIGQLIKIEADKLIIRDKSNKIIVITRESHDFRKIDCVPF